MRYRILSLACAAALTLALLAGCAQPEQPPVEPSPVEPSSAQAQVKEAPSTDDSPVEAEDAPLPDDEELARIVTALRAADPDECNISWDRGDAYDGLRVTRELLNGVAGLLATEPFVAIPEATYGAMYTDGGVAISFVSNNMPEDYASESLDIYLLSDHEENGEQAGKMRLSFSGHDGEWLQYVFEQPSYQALEELLENYLSSGEASFQGVYVPVTQTGAEEFPYANVRHCVQAGEQLLCVWEPSDGTERSILAVLDAATGTLVNRLELNSQVQRMEQVSGEEYSVRLVLGDGALYLAPGDLSSLYEYSPPAPVLDALWPEDLSPFDVDIAAAVLAYTAEDGIYLAADDGTGSRKLLDNGGIGEILADMELPEHEDSQLHYINPVLLDGGTKLAATIHMLTNGNYEPASYGVSVVDLQSGAAAHYPGFLSWLALPASRAGSTTLTAFGGDGINLLDVATGNLRTVEFDLYMEVTRDYATFVRTEDWYRNEDGEKVYDISVYTMDPQGSRSQPRTLVTVQADYVGVRQVTEDYALCSYGMEGQEGHGFFLVPLP